MHFFLKVKILLFIFFTECLMLSVAQAIKENPYGLLIISDIHRYDSLAKTDSNKRLVDLEKFIPEIKLDIRYATTNNFTHRQVYAGPKAYVRLPVGKALKEVEKELISAGLGLKVFDAYRPYAATLLFWDFVKDTLYVAAPWKGSRHNRACVVDVTLIDLKTGEELEMPTGYDDFTTRASVAWIPGSEKARINRQLLIDVMKKNGFTVVSSEWWHYDFNGWDKFEIMDLSFEELKNIR